MCLHASPIIQPKATIYSKTARKREDGEEGSKRNGDRGVGNHPVPRLPLHAGQACQRIVGRLEDDEEEEKAT